MLDIPDMRTRLGIRPVLTLTLTLALISTLTPTLTAACPGRSVC